MGPISTDCLTAVRSPGGLVDLLLDEKGVEWNGEQSCTEDARTFKERQYDRLADMLRRSLDMEAIYRILEQGLE